MTETTVKAALEYLYQRGEIHRDLMHRSKDVLKVCEFLEKEGVNSVSLSF